MNPEPAALVRSLTRPGTAPAVPEVRLHLGDEPIALWEAVEELLGRRDLDPPFWAFAWAGGQALARHVLDHPHLVRGRRVLDFAAGSGLVAVAAALAGAASVTANEIDPLAGAAVEVNAELNGVGVEVVIADLLTADPAAADRWNVVLAGDVFYDRAMAAAVLPFLDRARGRGALVLVGDPGRAYLPRDRMESVATYDIPVIRSVEDRDVRRTAVCRLS